MKNLSLPVNKHIWISTQRVIFFILFCLSCPLWGQGGKKLEPSDYSQWETMLPNKLSYDGKWVSYGLAKDNIAYKIIVQNTKTVKRFEIDSSYNNNFSAVGGWFCALDFNSVLNKIDLKKETITSINDVKSYQFAPFTEHIAYLKSSADGKSDALFIEDMEESVVSNFKGVTAYEFSPNGKYLGLLQQDERNKKLVIFDLLKARVYKDITVSDLTTNFLWQPDTKGLAFWEENGNANDIFWWQKIEESLAIKKFRAQEKNLSVTNIYRTPYLFSSDGKKLFFQAEKLNEMSEKEKPVRNKNVEIWNTKDEFVYPAAQSIQNYYPKTSFTIAWNKEGNGFNILGNEEAPMGVFGEQGEFAYSYGIKENIMAAWDKDMPSPISVYNIDDGTYKKILDNNYTLSSTVSPSGRYLSYFKEDHWFLYDAKKDSLTNLTINLPTSFAESLNKEIPKGAYGPPIWSEDEKEVALYDGYDIWLITPDGSKAKRITNGKETNSRFRFHLTTEDFAIRSKLSIRHNSNSVDLKRGVIFSVQSLEDGKTGYVEYSRTKGVVPIVFEEALYSNLRMSADRKTIVYSVETYQHPPKLVVQDLKTGKEQMVYQSNPQHFDYQWGKEELVKFESPKGAPIKGILYYPSNFDPTKKYPMIVSIYEIQSKDFYKYYNPTLHSRIGFGISNFTTNGYFVFLPDIVYEIGDPGISALDCVLESLDTLADRKYIDKERVGLYGHSFGGYESMFILTQTDRFATVVAGAGASNLLSFYLSMSWIWDRPQYTRFERQQWRMGDTYFNIPEAYNRNSPINFAQNISTPFLGWAGKKDSNVNWEQHLEFYLALRKLEKEHIMLLYPEEGHDISKPANQKDLTIKIMEWYNFYLKDLSAAEWMTGIN